MRIEENTILNQITAKWFNPRITPPKLDCVGCTKPGKCCNFQPFVPNFYLGAMLEEGMKVDLNKATLQPLGVMSTAEFRASPSLCTYYDKGLCRIWKFRPGECSLNFCEGDSFEAWKEEIFEFESGVAQMALAYLGFSPSVISQQVDELNSPSRHSISRAEAEEIYRFSWNWFQGLSEEEVRSWFKTS